MLYSSTRISVRLCVELNGYDEFSVNLQAAAKSNLTLDAFTLYSNNSWIGNNFSEVVCLTPRIRL